MEFSKTKYLIVLLLVSGCNSKTKKEGGSAAANCPTTSPATTTPTPAKLNLEDSSLFSDTITPTPATTTSTTTTTPSPAPTTPAPATATPASSCPPVTTTPTPTTPSTTPGAGTTSGTASTAGTTTGSIDSIPIPPGVSPPPVPPPPPTPTNILAGIKTAAQNCQGFYKVVQGTCDTTFNRVECFENINGAYSMFNAIAVTNATVDSYVNGRKASHGGDLKPISCGVSKTNSGIVGASFVGLLINDPSSFDKYCLGTGTACQ